MYCAICKNKLKNSKFRDEENKYICKCDGCEISYDPTALKLSGSDLKQMYEQMYFKINDKSYNRSIAYKIKSALVSIIKSKCKKRSKLLDIGCSYGELLTIFNKEGWETTGIDVSTEAIKYAVSKGLNATVNCIEDYQPNEKFDVIVLSHVLEHLRSPVEAISLIIEKVLADDGMLFINVPNLQSDLSNRFKFVFNGELKPNEHIYYFSTLTLRNVLLRVGGVVWEEHSAERYSVATLINCFVRSRFINKGNQLLEPMERSTLGKSAAKNYFILLKLYESILSLLNWVKVGKSDRELIFVVKKMRGISR